MLFQVLKLLVLDILGRMLWRPAVFRAIVDFITWLLPSFDVEFPNVRGRFQPV